MSRQVKQAEAQIMSAMLSVAIGVADLRVIALGLLNNPERALAHWCVYNNGDGYIYGADYPTNAIAVTRNSVRKWLT